MVILINERACAGKALKKWNRIEKEIRNRYFNYVLVKYDENSINELKDELRKGCTHFVAAGGDGTVNYLLNTIVSIADEKELRRIKFGAIGLGSSNDFHKPFRHPKYLDRIPCRIDFENTFTHDLGFITWEGLTGERNSRCWINNSSVGVTAEANYFFNHPNSKLLSLKQKNTNTAIYYTAIRTILSYKNIPADISYDDSNPLTTELTNLGIIKNPSFSGSFCYDSPYMFNGGFFFVHICERMTTMQTLCTLYNLSKKKFRGFRGTRSYKSNKVIISSGLPFAVEFDGETIKTNKAEFSIKKNAVQICL